MEFIRFGGLSSVKQKGYDSSMPALHSPPARRGIYAFPLGCIVPFLLGGSRNTAKGMHRYVRDKRGNRLNTDQHEDLFKNTQKKPYVTSTGFEFFYDRNFYKVYSIDEHGFWRRPAKMKRFEYAGEIWHHLSHNLKPSQILATKGRWCLSDIDDYKIAFDKESLKLRWDSTAAVGKRITEIKGKFGVYSIDHLEVFIEKV